MTPIPLEKEPAYEPLDLGKKGLFQRLDLRPGYNYDLEAYDLPGAIGITHDPSHLDISHLYARLCQGFARLFNPRCRGIDHHLVHGFGVLRPLGDDPHDEVWLVGHSTWHGGVTSKRQINHLAWNDDGTRVWHCTHAGVRFWTRRVFDLMCFRRQEPLPEDTERPKFSTCAGATLFCNSPQLRKQSTHTQRRIAAAVADVLVGDQICTISGDHVRRFTCLALVTFALQAAICINLLEPDERQEIQQIQDRAARIDKLVGLFQDADHPCGYFTQKDSIGLQNTRFAWPAVFGRSLDQHSEFVDVSTIETEGKEPVDPARFRCC